MAENPEFQSVTDSVIVPPEGPEAEFIFQCFLLVSLAVLLYGAFFLYRRLREDPLHNLKKGIQKFTLFLFGATVFMFIPVYLKAYRFGGDMTVFRSILMSIHNAMRLFILDGEFDIITQSVEKLRDGLRLAYSAYAALLYVAGPAAVSITIVVSFARGAFNELKFRQHRNSRVFIFSCLNEESAAMAQSILDGEADGKLDGGKKRRKSLIVFCDLSQEEDEQETLKELLSALSTEHAAVLSVEKSISRFKVSRFRDEITFFLMDENEAKNIEDASALCAALTERFQQEKPNAAPPQRRVLVYASSPASGPLIDAMSKKVSVPSATIQGLQGIIGKAAQSEASRRGLDAYDIDIASDIQASDLWFSAPFSVMRVDSEKQMVMRMVQEINDARNATTITRDTEEVTVTLLGLGGIGKQILENILWSYQQYGCRLIVNVFDAVGPALDGNPEAAGNPIYDRLMYQWPELMKTNRAWQENENAHPDTEANYDVRFFMGTDCFTKRFRDYFEASEYSGRLMKSSLILCAMGDDDRNLEAALMMRQLFSGKTDRKPDIYAVVYDDQKAENFTSQEKITNYKNQPYDILVKGSMRSQYSFSGIEKIEQDEKAALVYHINWLWVKSEEEKAENAGPKASAQKEAEALRENLTREMNNYIHYEYFRRASMAKAAHKRSLGIRNVYPRDELLKESAVHNAKDKTCRCLICQSRITEHMRWNVFMRVNGYCYGEKRNDMAKIHPCLRAWDELPPSVRVKD